MHKNTPKPSAGKPGGKRVKTPGPPQGLRKRPLQPSSSLLEAATPAASSAGSQLAQPTTREATPTYPPVGAHG